MCGHLQLMSFGGGGIDSNSLLALCCPGFVGLSLKMLCRRLLAEILTINLAKLLLTGM
jgi:hypothetical protein